MSSFRRDPRPGSDDSRNRDSRRGAPRGGPSRRPQVPMPAGRPFRTLAFWALIVLLSLVAYRMYQGNIMAPQRAEISYTRFMKEVRDGNIKSLQIMENGVTGELNGPSALRVNGQDVSFKAFKTNIVGDGANLPDKVWEKNKDAEIDVRPAGFNWVSVLLSWLPLVIIFGAWLFLIRQMQSGGSAALKFGKTKARVLLESQPKVTFKDVAGCEEAKQELQEIIEFLKEPQKFQRLGGRIPKGALLLGPPGSGKTLLAKAVAGEAAVPFFSMSGSDFVEMFVGVGASVTGDTPVLVRHDGRTELVEIGAFVDRYYEGDTEGFVIPVRGVETLGFEEAEPADEGGAVATRMRVRKWSAVRGVFRHRATEIVEIRCAGSVLRTTPDHSVFTSRGCEMQAVAARELREGDRLVGMPPGGADATQIVRLGWSAAPENPLIESVTVRRFDGFVYDLCGCENEAFFGGERPVLLHNSRVRDLFEQAKRNAPCLTGDTMVTLSGGRQVAIRDMFENQMVGVRVPAMAEDYRLDDATVIGITCKPSTELFEVTTSTSAIKATGNHLFPVLRGDGMEWVRADELKEGEYVAVPRVIPTTPSPLPLFYDLLPAEDVVVHLRGHRPGTRRPKLFEIRQDIGQYHRDIERLSIGVGGFGSSYLDHIPFEIDDELAYLCGLIASDGYFGQMGERAIQFVNTQLALHERVREICMAEFDYEPKRHLNKKHYEIVLPQGTHPVTLQDCYTTYINNRLLCDALRTLQSRILEMPAPIIGSWLRGVFDGDGCVRFSERAPQVIISAWKQEANQLIRDALLRAGIVTSRPRSVGEGREGNIVVTGRDMLLRFSSRVGSEHPEKLSKLHDLVCLLMQRETSSSRLDSVPAAGLIRSARQSMRMGQRAFSRGHVVSAYERGLVSPSRGSLQTVVEEMESWRQSREIDVTPEFQRLRDLADSAILWSRIQSINRTPSSEPVYDLCLDRHNCFIANNLIVHNCIVFVDEIDAVGRHRGAGLGGGHDEREQTLNQLLVEMDGFDSNEGVIMIAATNRPDVLDPALLRPGRFDRQIVVDWPDVRGREGILKVHTRKIPLAEDVDLKQIARSTPGLAGADIANLVNEAALLAARRNRKKVTAVDFADAKDKVMLGMERKSLVMSEDERRSTAYHESGHALIAWLLPGADPVDKISIIPRGRALGITSYVPQEERYSRSREDLLRTLAMMMGGRAAEFLIFNHFTTGAANDIERATALARKMVCELGMSENLGPLTFGKKEEMVFLGKEIATHKDYSELTAEKIDSEVRSLVEGAYNHALKVLKENLEKLHLLAGTLLEREVLDGDQMNRVLRGEKLEPMKPAEPEPPSGEAPAAKEPAGPQIEPFGPPAPRPAGA
ncbi:MAG: ATP-dependent metallopeptidase FtsH/Yme1/Tma family protein [Candidatus Eisenbacteria bacterium]|nr:ATP-dependent metallopeptidase FtsH/Yme1/Tma family protein [Candidatus Eisenbacteria bacterium]